MRRVLLWLSGVFRNGISSDDVRDQQLTHARQDADSATLTTGRFGD